jgi:predicted negative regulator of RcsB-dependent stress response
MIDLRVVFVVVVLVVGGVLGWAFVQMAQNLPVYAVPVL